MGAPQISTQSATRFRVLLVEDDPVIGNLVQQILDQDGYAVQWAEKIRDAEKLIDTTEFHLIILDGNLPDGDGFELCRRWRSEGRNTPVLFLTSRVDEESLVRGLSMGGNDYLRKPFGKKELLARLKLQLRGKKGTLNLGSLSLDFDRKVAKIDEQPLKLTPTELQLLGILARHAGSDLSRETLLAEIDPEVEIEERTLDSHMSHIRKKLQTAASGRITLVSVYGVGYRLRVE